jgi:hypothetical protein
MRDSKGTAKRQNTKPPVSGKKPASRVQLHLGEQTVQRLGVHCSLVGRNASRVADEILSTWLGRFGKGREIFPASVDSSDRLDPADSITPDAES